MVAWIDGAGDHKIRGQPARRGGGRLAAILVLISGLAVLWKLLLLSLDAFPFNSDEAVVALMARHVLQGEFPFFFYGQAYLGSLDALLVASGFAIFGEKVIVIRIVQALLYAATIATSMLLVHNWRSDWGTTVITGILLAIPPVNVTLYTTVSLGGYGEALLIGNLIVLFALRYMEDTSRGGSFMAWGLLVGLGWWAFGLTLVYSIPTAVMLGLSIRRNRLNGWRAVLPTLAAFGLGSLPWFLGLWQEGLGRGLQEVTGSAIAGASSDIWYLAVLEHARNFIVFGPTVILGLRAPWSPDILHPIAAILIGTLWLSAFVSLGLRALRSKVLSPFAVIWIGVAGSLIAGFIITAFGADPTGRYFLPLTIPISILGAVFLGDVSRARRWPASAIAVLLLVIYNTIMTLQLARLSPPGLTTQFAAVARVDHSQIGELVTFLERHEETRGYTNYWIAYPLAFHSQEKLIFVPRLPYHHDFRFAERDSRYEPYEEAVGEADRAAFITANHERLNEELRSGLTAIGVTFREDQIGPYTVFHNLSRKVNPTELDLPGDG